MGGCNTAMRTGPCRSIPLHSTPRHHLPFADGSFDIVFSCFSPSPWDEFCRVLRPGGALPTLLHLAAPLHRRTAAPPHRCTHPPLHCSAHLSSAQLASARTGTPAHLSSGAIIVVRAGATHLQAQGVQRGPRREVHEVPLRGVPQQHSMLEVESASWLWQSGWPTCGVRRPHARAGRPSGLQSGVTAAWPPRCVPRASPRRRRRR